MLKLFRLAAKLLWREWRAGEWYIVFFALVLAIAATTTIHFYINRLQRGLEQQSAKSLGGDLVISSPTPLPTAWSQKAAALQLKTAEVWSYLSVVSVKNQLQLVSIQAVSKDYPLIGDHKIHPNVHTIWVEPRLLPLLSLQLNDSITIGTYHFRLAKILTPDIDTFNSGWGIAPRILMRLDEVPATRTVLAGSRVDYRLLLAGEKKHRQQFIHWLRPRLRPSQRLLDSNSPTSAFKEILERAEDYLQLIILICLLMSGVAIALSIQQYLRRHYAHVALWQCLGAKRRQIIGIFLIQLILIALFSSILAISIGFYAQTLFANLFKNFVQFLLPSPSSAPVILGLVICVALLFAFSLPVIIQLPRISPVFLWHNQVPLSSLRSNIFIIACWTGILVLVYWFLNLSPLTLYFSTFILLSIAFLYALSLCMLVLLRILLAYTEGAIRRGLSQLRQHSQYVSLQFIGFNLIFISLIVLGMIKNDLIENWRHSLPESTPNYFAFNIAPTDVKKLQQFFQQQQIMLAGMYPMTRGRLIMLNGQPILNTVPKEARNNNALHRELNLSWMWELPADNKIVKGKNWTLQDAKQPFVSVENKLATDLQLHLGDELMFQIGNQKVTATIVNFRALNWSSFHPNFFMIFPPGLLATFPTTYITSFHLQAEQIILLNQLVALFPNITIVDVASLLQQMQAFINKTATGMQYLFGFALGIGVLIFIASLQVSLDERRRTYHLLRILGASRHYIYKSILAEFSCFFLLILLSSTTLALLIIYLLERHIFTM